MKEHEGEKGVGEGRIRMVCIGGGSMRREHEEGAGVGSLRRKRLKGLLE